MNQIVQRNLPSCMEKCRVTVDNYQLFTVFTQRDGAVINIGKDNQYDQFGHVLCKRRIGLFAVCDETGHADNHATFAPCVQSMTADFISQNAQCFQTRVCFIISSDKSLLL